jgi:putative tributyrin esterase
MAIFQGSIFSKTLGMYTGLSVATPKETSAQDGPYRVIYLLHGLSDNHSCWLSNTQLNVFAEEYRVMFVMPEVQRSFYTDMESGLPYFTYVTQELPEIIQSLFRVSPKREDTAVMGLSMGGYGALKCALTFPERYSLCCAFSSACGMKERVTQMCSSPNCGEAQAIWGTALKPENDLFVLAQRTAEHAQKPKIFMTCGTEDDLLEENRRLRDHLQAMPYDYQYREWAGEHNWYFWNESLHLMLETYYR